MSDTIVCECQPSGFKITISDTAESGTYAGVATVRVIAPITDAIEQSRTLKSAFTRLIGRSYDVDVLLLRKIADLHQGDSNSVLYAYYIELHVHKKKAESVTLSFALPQSWAPYVFTCFVVGTILNTCFISSNTVSTKVQLFETDPVSRAKQIYDSV